MSRPRLTASAATAWALAAATAAVLLTLFIAVGPSVDATGESEIRAEVLLELPIVVGFMVFAVVGALVASRQPTNPIGWSLIVIGLSFSTSITAEEYLRVAPRDPSSAVVWIALLHQVLWVPFIALVPLVILLFPDGRLPSPRWRWFLVAFTSFFAVRSFADLGAATVGLEGDAEGYANPLPFAETLRTIGALAPDLAPLYAFWFLLPGMALFQRLRRSHGAERQQLKWFVYASALSLVLIVAAAVLDGLGMLSGTYGDAVWMLTLLSFTTLPVAIAVAIFRFRLYEIDVLINRTIVYFALTLVLGSVYVATVLGAQALLGPLTGGNEVGVAASTLLVVALFRPLRRRIQGTVDRRFYRSRYDSQRTLDAFAARLRDEVDLDDVRVQLLAAVHATVQPRGASVWFRQERG